MLERLMAKYGKITNGAQLRVAGVVPKTAHEYDALILLKRLNALRDLIDSETSDESLGSWVPAVVPGITRSYRSLQNATDIKNNAQEGMKIKGKIFEGRGNKAAGVDIEDRVGTIVRVKDKGMQVNFGARRPIDIPYNKLVLLAPEDSRGFTITKELELSPGVQADKEQGHKIRFPGGYQSAKDSNFSIVKNAQGTLVDYDGENIIKIKLDQPASNGELEFSLGINDAQQTLQVSNLGVYAPQNREDAIREEVMSRVFPRTILDQKSMETVVRAGLSLDHRLFVGKPSTGKSQLAKDLQAVSAQRGVMIKVEGCASNCHPASLYDPQFRKKCPPCAKCMINYDQGTEGREFKETRFFTPPKAEQVKIIAVRYGPDGYGIEQVHCTNSLKNIHLEGFKLPNFSARTDEQNDESDPTGFHLGALLRANNGMIIFDEVDKMRSAMQTILLHVLEDNVLKPNQLKYLYPANSVFVGTANTVEGIIPALNDRVAFIPLDFTLNTETAYRITRVALHREFAEVDEVNIGDVHTEKGFDIMSVPIPTPLEKAIETTYINFRKSYDGDGANEITSSNRSKFDAHHSARASLVLDQIFHPSTAKSIVTERYVRDGLKYAFVTRMQLDPGRESRDGEEALSNWVDENFEEILKGERGAWWCEAYKHIGTIETINRKMGLRAGVASTNFNREMRSYRSDHIMDAYTAVKQARKHPGVDVYQDAIERYPFMDYVFSEQPRFEKFKKIEVEETITYLMSCQEDSNCPRLKN